MSPKNKVEPVTPDRMINISELLRQTAEAHATINWGAYLNPPMDDSEIVERVLPLANERSSVSEIEIARDTTQLSHDHPRDPAAYEELAMIPEMRKLTLDFWDRTRERREWFRSGLLAIIEDPTRAARSLGQDLDGLINQIVIIPQLTWDGKSLVRQDYLHSLSLGGTLAYVLMLLLDPDRGLTPALRQCKLNECGRFFLSRSKGGRRPLYCSQTCRDIGNAFASVETTRRWREKKANQRKKK
jgi:hypothetical protein